MSSRLSNSIFQGRPSDKLLVKDTYQVTTEESRNSIFDTVKGIFSDAIGGLKSNTSSPRDLVELIQDAAKGGKSKLDLLNQAMSAVGTTLPAILGQVGGTLQNTLGDFLTEQGYGNVADLGKLVYGSATTIISGADANDTESLIKFVGEMTGKSELMEYFNLGAEAGILGGIAKMLVTYGVGSLVDDLVEMAHDESVKDAIFQAIIEDAINTSDLNSINKALDKLGADGLLSERPLAIAEILAAYRFPEDFNIANIAAERKRLIDTLIRISPYWCTKLRNNVPTPDYTNFMRIGTDARTLMMVQEPERTYVIGVGSIQANTVGGVNVEMYPNAYFTTR